MLSLGKTAALVPQQQMNQPALLLGMCGTHVCNSDCQNAWMIKKFPLPWMAKSVPSMLGSQSFLQRWLLMSCTKVEKEEMWLWQYFILIAMQTFQK